MREQEWLGLSILHLIWYFVLWNMIRIVFQIISYSSNHNWFNFKRIFNNCNNLWQKYPVTHLYYCTNNIEFVPITMCTLNFYTFKNYTFKSVIFKTTGIWLLGSSRHFREHFDFYTFKNYTFESVGVDRHRQWLDNKPSNIKSILQLIIT